MLRCNVLLLGRRQGNQSYRGHQSLEREARTAGPYEPVRHKLPSHRAGAAYPSLRRPREQTLRAHDLGGDPFRPSERLCVDELALSRLEHQEVRERK